MRAPVIRGLGILSAWGRGTAALPEDARAAAEGRAVLSLGRLAREGERWRRSTREGLIAIAAAEAAIEDAGAAPHAVAGERTALIYVTAAAYGPSNRRFIEGRGGGIHFAETAPAVVPAEVAIALGLAGPYAILLGGPPATLRAIAHAATLLQAGACDRALVLAVEIFEECADLYTRAGRLVGRPLVEAAACLWLEPGRGSLRLDPAPPPPASSALRRRLGETFSVEPLAALDWWRQQGAVGTLELEARWRSESTRLIWTEPMTPVRESAA
jgi:hypothetical protein